MCVLQKSALRSILLYIESSCWAILSYWHNQGILRHTIKGIPVGQFLRVRRICSDAKQFELEATSLYQWFLNRGYPKWMINRTLAIARGKDRKDLLEKRIQGNNLHQTKLTLSTPYSVEFGDKEYH